MTPVAGLRADLIQVAHSGTRSALRGIYVRVVVIAPQTPGIALPVLLGDLPGQCIDVALQAGRSNASRGFRMAVSRG